MFNMWPM